MAKQIARKMDAKTGMKNDRREAMEERAKQRFRARELQKAKKMLGEDFAQRRSARGAHREADGHA
jgi:hypothetical protein